MDKPTAAGEKFPLRESYPFASANGLGEEAEKIRTAEILEWDKAYTSGVRRGWMIALLEEKGLLSKFISEKWNFGNTAKGISQCKSFVRIAEEYKTSIASRAEQPASPHNNVNISTTIEDLENTEYFTFALEAHLRDFLARNIQLIEPGLQIFQPEDSEEGVEFPIDKGRIDILAVDKNNKFVVIEFKLSRGRNQTLGQISYYMGWVDKNLGRSPCRGIIIAQEISEDLKIAVSTLNRVELMQYRMTFQVEPVLID